jgi:flagellar basal-body rod protein FlgC
MIAPLVALSGLQAATLRLDVSASNVANINTSGATARAAAAAAAQGQTVYTGYQPLMVQQVAVPGYGVVANVRPNGSPPRPVYAPSSRLADSDGMVDMPDVDPAEESVAQIQAASAYRATLSVIRTSDEMEQSLLDLSA